MSWTLAGTLKARAGKPRRRRCRGRAGRAPEDCRFNQTRQTRVDTPISVEQLEPLFRVDCESSILYHSVMNLAGHSNGI
jgi:hypothetical protein